MKHSRGIVVGCFTAVVILGGCAHAPPAAGNGAAGSAPPAEPTAPATHIATSDAYGLFLSTAACWGGGVWAQAEGEEMRSDRKLQTDAHCKDVIAAIQGPKGDDASLRQLRAVEDGAVADIAEKLGMLPGQDTDRSDLRALLLALAPAMRENMYARRAADKVRRDVDGDRPVAKLSDDERAAVEPLSAHAAVSALVAQKAGNFTADAHALGVLAAMDRFEIARGLPRHLKVYAVRDMGKLMFGATAPDADFDPTRPVQPGTWLTYITNLAIAAGHAVPASATNPRTRHDIAWAGVLAGIADKLEPDVAGASSRLQPILRNVVAHLRAEHDQVVHPRQSS